jgi:hypothetical protein
MLTYNPKIANRFGIVSIVLSLVPALYIFHARIFPVYALTEAVVLLGGVGGSFFAALVAGFVGSRWWFTAIFAAVVDVVLVFGFSP